MRLILALAFSALVLASGSGPSPAAQKSWSTSQPAHDVDRLSVMTYNVEGLPFPIALNRSGALQQIGLRLAELRRQGRQPNVVLLQEAFTPQAKQIAALAGYPFIASGPGPTALKAARATVMPDSYDAAAKWRNGEGMGKWVDSGLLVLSDYPIAATSSMTFADDACAGFDCLAAKGVLLAWIKLPARKGMVAVADTHLNSRRATGVSVTRADAAFTEQLREARGFIADRITPAASIIFGGDFNIGHSTQRNVQIDATPPLPGAAREAITDIWSGRSAGFTDRDLQSVVDRAKDKQFYRAGAGKTLKLEMVDVPFGIASGGYDLSDHLGYVASYGMH